MFHRAEGFVGGQFVYEGAIESLYSCRESEACWESVPVTVIPVAAGAVR